VRRPAPSRPLKIIKFGCHLMDRTIAVSDLDEQLPAADSQVNPTAGKSGLAQRGLPHTRCCSSALARSREGLCLIRPSQAGQCLGRSASFIAGEDLLQDLGRRAGCDGLRSNADVRVAIADDL
jgi:hypothetical protein